MQRSDPAWVWDCLIQSTRPFLYIHYVLPTPLLSKIHSLMSHNFFSVFIPFQGSNCPPVPRAENKEGGTVSSQTRSSLFSQTNPFCFPFVGRMTASLLERQPPPQPGPSLDKAINGSSPLHTLILSLISCFTYKAS